MKIMCEAFDDHEKMSALETFYSLLRKTSMLLSLLLL